MKTYQVPPVIKEQWPAPKFYEVRQNGVVIYRNTSIKLCQWWKRENGFLTATVHSIR